MVPSFSGGELLIIEQHERPPYENSPPTATTEASQDRSNGFSKSGRASTGADANFKLRASNAVYCSSPHTNSHLPDSKLLIGAAIFAKLDINLLQKLAKYKKY